MPTSLLMMSSAITMLALGLSLTFAPQEVLTSAGSSPSWVLFVIVQATGALYLGFAMLNWMAKDNLIGGIYSRPVALGNFLHFAVMAMTLLRVFAAGHHTTPLLAVLSLYLVFAAWFGLVLFGVSLKRERA